MLIAACRALPCAESLSLSFAQVAKVSESDADYRKFYVESGATAMRLRAETKCARGPARGLQLPANDVLVCHLSPCFSDAPLCTTVMLKTFVC